MLARTLVVVAAALVAGDAYGAGFSLADQGASGLGRAYAGEVAVAEDATTIVFNPAGLSRLPGGQIVLVGHVLQVDVEYEDQGSTVGRRFGNAPLTGEREAGTHPLGLAPSGALSWQVAPRWWLGVGVVAPFGFRTSYPGGWVGRYHANESDLKTVEIAPTMAFQVSERLSLGASLLVEYAHVRLSSALDLGAICEINAGQLGASPGSCADLGLPVQGVDGFVRIKGDSWGFGYHLGALFEVSPRTRVGLSYRSLVRHDFDGPAEFVIPARADVLRATGALQTTSGRFDLDLPEIVRLGAYHEIDARWAIMAGITWTNWSRFSQITFRFDNPAQPPLVQPERWNDAWRYALGVARRLGPRWLVQLGTAYDETPVPSARLRTARIPDSDRVWIAAGVGWHATERIRLDVGYAHLFGLGSETRNPDPVSGHVLRGQFRGSGNLFGLQIEWVFR